MAYCDYDIKYRSIFYTWLTKVGMTVGNRIERRLLIYYILPDALKTTHTNSLCFSSTITPPYAKREATNRMERAEQSEDYRHPLRGPAAGDSYVGSHRICRQNHLPHLLQPGDSCVHAVNAGNGYTPTLLAGAEVNMPEPLHNQGGRLKNPQAEVEVFRHLGLRPKPHPKAST